MACQTCDHTMQGISRVFWCPRCGTIKMPGSAPEFEAPSIVDRVHAFMKYAKVDGSDPFVESIYRSLVECVG